MLRTRLLPPFRTLDLIPDPSFVHTAGDTFTILTCSSRSGTFGTVTGNGYPFTGHVQVLYQPGAVKLVMIGTTAVDPRAATHEVRFAAVGVSSRMAFQLELPEAASDVRVALFDVTGREVAVLFDGALPAGQHRLEPDGARTWSSGVYFARVVVREGTATVERVARALLRR